MKFSSCGIVACMLAVSLFALQANGGIILSDNFDYADGDITTESGGVWTAHSGPGSAPVQVVSGQAVVTHGGGSREDVNQSFSLLSSGKIYYGFDFSVDDIGTAYFGSDNEYFAHFNSTSSSFLGRIDIVSSIALGDYTVGIASYGSTAEATWGTDLSYNTTYRAIVLYDIDENQATLWINPASETSTYIRGTDGEDTFTVDSFSLRQSNSTEDETVRIDGLVVGTTFNDVFTAIPEPAAWVFMCPLALGVIVVMRMRMRIG